MSSSLRILSAGAAVSAAFFAGAAAVASEGAGAPSVGFQPFGIPAEFILFGLTLLGVALFHKSTFTVAMVGLAVIIAYKLFFVGFHGSSGLEGLGAHLWDERIVLSNLFLLLLGFAVLSRHFEDSRAPEAMPRVLPAGWLGGVALLAMVFVISSFLDNIAAALIGGVVAKHVYRKVYIGYLAGIVAASNAGGSGSVVGDTTTTMMWIDGVSPFDVLHAYVAAGAAFFIFAIPLSIVQQTYSPLQKHREGAIAIDWMRVGVVAFILVSAIAANAGANLFAPHLLEILPVIGLGVWAAILVAALVRPPSFKTAADSIKGTVFLLALVTSASLMPVEKLPPASWETTLVLGFVSAVFDNIPLTALALKQGGYDWGMLAYAVGFGGSMIWFGSSAGVAISNLYPEAKSAFRWLFHGFWVAIAYVVGFFVLLSTLGWGPHERHKDHDRAPTEHTLSAPMGERPAP